ncbi:DUF4167 domain-containing protein [Sphingomonas parva]|uniref:DUF4167 domain-containing protein n=1 Tax=Sphingomonas parva TaxID=2555898 RepID=A0A4Y8ZQN0_9SPHN|nr:DUF4167 domain-containing protein [Sphingomonas parva]
MNNRQNGRRRGRGGGGPRPNQSPQGNRQDNRSRGNAAQLLEKYKSLARDAQLQGDRVQSEYYLQFADHYFRVLNENRARFEEQRPRRDDFYSDEDEDQDEVSALDGDEGEDVPTERPERSPRGERQERVSREDRGERQERTPREDRGERQERAPREDRGERQERPRREERAERPERKFERRPRREERNDEGGAGEGEAESQISLDVLPPAISVVEGDGPAKPRRRTRRPRTEADDTDIAPAA